MIKTKTALKREKRNSEIIATYQADIKLDGAMKSAVVESIARNLKVSITTVNRVVKGI